MRPSLLVLVALAAAVVLAACSSSSSPPDAGMGQPSLADAEISEAESSDGASAVVDSSVIDSGTGTSPAEGSTGMGPAVGDPCASDSQCPSIGGGGGTCMTSWPNGGSCTVVACAGQCPDNNTVCSVYQDQTYCVVSCEPGIIACTRAGYTCLGGGCFPDNGAGGDGG